jgi:DNA-binding GntR family transcriptional regulator
MTRDTAISRSVLSDQVKDRLLQAILDGRYPPGSRIVETRAAREFGTSQAPVREALRDLEALGVVEIAAFRGARVRHPSTDELLEAYVVRSSLEELGVRLALPQLTPGDITDLEGCLDAMRRAADAQDAHAEAIADTQFHGRLIEIAGNATLERVWRRLEPFSRTYLTMITPGADRRRIANLHEPVLDALRAGSADGAATAIERHFSVARMMLGTPWEVQPSALDAAAPTTRRSGRAGPARSAPTAAAPTAAAPAARLRPNP